ncbi:MAG: 6-carboxytetrahydropterin synthase [Armatimonadetes bacterium]|nr:6-carboxytetrahydropterin synthase [Armatimonadota bacterium]
MVYRICKQFEVESGHLLSKHAERCRFPHGHSRRVEVVVEANALDEHDMVVDFKALKLAVGEFIDRYDHAMCIHVDHPLYADMVRCYGEEGRIIAYQQQDPTTEVMAREMFDYIAAQLEGGRVLRGESGNEYRLPAGLKLRRVRLWETSSSWAEVEAD